MSKLSGLFKAIRKLRLKVAHSKAMSRLSGSFKTGADLVAS